MRSYFSGEKSPETAAMKGGKKIHALIEAGALTVKHSYSNAEKILTQILTVRNAGDTADIEYKVLGIPDDYSDPVDGSVMFVDYKSGKENVWDNRELAGDLKMKTTAWLVWKNTGCPPFVRGYIEHIPTQWNPNTKEIEPTGGDSVVAAEMTYTGEELEAFTAVILKTMHEVNVGYEEWLTSTDEFVSQEDVAQYAELDIQRRALESKQELILERISDQMALGKKDNLSTPFGSFYFKSTKKFPPIPATAKINYLDRGITWEDAEQISAAAAAFKKKFETENDPVEVKKSLQFRIKK